MINFLIPMDPCLFLNFQKISTSFHIWGAREGPLVLIKKNGFIINLRPFEEFEDTIDQLN